MSFIRDVIQDKSFTRKASLKHRYVQQINIEVTVSVFVSAEMTGNVREPRPMKAEIKNDNVTVLCIAGVAYAIIVKVHLIFVGYVRAVVKLINYAVVVPVCSRKRLSAEEHQSVVEQIVHHNGSSPGGRTICAGW
jgi:hypothetical protein